MHGCWRKLTEVIRLHGKLTEAYKRSPGSTRVNRSTSRCTGTRQKLLESLPSAWKVVVSWRKVSRQHVNLTKLEGRSPVCVEIWRKLTEGFPVTWNSDGNGRKVYGHTESWWKMKEGLQVKRKVDGGWWKVSQPCGKLTEGLQAAKKFDGSWQTVGCTESW